MSNDILLKSLSKLFGSYKAEWLQDSLFELYTEPSYFPELTTARPCVLTGGRGTGKTTVLRSLSYMGQWEFLKRDRKLVTHEERIKAAQQWPYIGFYYRVNTARVTAFQGTGLEELEWQKLFLHYINLTFSQNLITFFKWHIENINYSFNVRQSLIEEICAILSLEKASSLGELDGHVGNALLMLETYINNIGLDDKPRLSSTGALDAILTKASQLPEFKGKTFFLIFDEYENFTDNQQQAINTLIKHTNASFTFKIGVRQLGWRVKHTLNASESLISPADYVLINIAEKLTEDDFSQFAENICNSRILKLQSDNDIPNALRVRELLIGLSTEKEAELLGISDVVSGLRMDVEASQKPILQDISSQLSDLDLYIVKYWSDGQKASFLETLSTVNLTDTTWRYRFEEYRYAALFYLTKGRAGIRKYYVGWDVFCKLSCTNIRYMMELVEQALLLHFKEDRSLDSPISPKTQTTAAKAIGKKNLEELQGLSTFGAKLTKLVLGLGRVFGQLAAQAAGHAHEVNQFRLTTPKGKFHDSEDVVQRRIRDNVDEILKAAIMHLAIVTFPGNKPKNEGDIKDNTFLLHPIFSPYFIFSHRRRRNLFLNEAQVLGIIEDPQRTIEDILKKNNREKDGGPSQLQLFDLASEQE